MTELWYLVADMWISTFFYGIYLVLFCICIYILLHRPLNLANTILLVTAIALFVLSSLQTIINIILGAADIDNINIPYDQLFYAGNMLYVANNAIADALFIYRCYVIWNHNIYVVVAPFIMVVVTIVFGVDQALPLAPFFGITLGTNVLVTGLTAGRIWWIGRQNRVHLKPDMRARYMSSISIIVESGVIYSAGILTWLILQAIPFTFPAADPTAVMLSQVVGIVPTLIIVRVGLGISVQSGSNVSSATLLNSDVDSRSRPHILGIVRSDKSGIYDLEQNIQSSDSNWTR
ncbi:hypothetical protein MSAN_01065000 [Mycena sanguinolenta]|uniref:Uncharacterized protein n=1 Tax=Mycena sanguinolenta TaxID=230812 RepID=A0A8H7D935_9AGAR|nr:hypothetical protein MSAN_01065000 [Mycena sanguinolenta]